MFSKLMRAFMRISFFILIILLLNVIFLYAESDELFFTNMNLFNDYYDESPDARSAALGRTSILNPNGAFNVFVNSANLCDLDGIEIGCGTKLSRVMLDIKSQHYDYYEYQSTFEFKNGNGYRISPITCAFPVKIINEEFSFGIGRRILNDYNLDVKEAYREYNYNEYYSGEFNVITLASGYRVNNKLSIGLNYNLNNKSEANYHNNYYTFSREDYTSVADFGFFVISGNYQLSQKSKLSLLLKPGYDIKYENAFHWRRYGYYDYDNYYHYTINVPFQYALAYQYHLLDKATLSIEYKNIALNNYKINKKRRLYDYTYLNESFSDKTIHSDNGSEINIGLELNTKYPLRIGFYSASVPVYNNKYINSQIVKRYSEPERKTGFTLGFGSNFKKLFIDVSADWSSVSYSQRSLHYNTLQYIYDYYYIRKNNVTISEYLLSIGYHI